MDCGYCLGLMGQKGGRLGFGGLGFVLKRKWAVTGTRVTVSNSMDFLTKNEGKQTMCSIACPRNHQRRSQIQHKRTQIIDITSSWPVMR